MPIDEAVREGGATIFSISGLLKLFLSIPRGLEPSSTQVAVAACFAKRVASPASEAGRNRRTGRSDGVAGRVVGPDRPSGLPCQSYEYKVGAQLGGPCRSHARQAIA